MTENSAPKRGFYSGFPKRNVCKNDVKSKNDASRPGRKNESAKSQGKYNTRCVVIFTVELAERSLIQNIKTVFNQNGLTSRKSN